MWLELNRTRDRLGHVMKCLWLAGIFVVSSVLADASPVPIVPRNARNYVNSKTLEQTLGIVVKSLPAEKQMVVCYREHCAVLEGVIAEADGLLVPLDSLEKALNSRAVIDDSRKTVTFNFSKAEAAAHGSAPGVGRLAPDFRLTKLDGRSINFSAFHGKRVLINSWASW
jgi:hypothetical protein